MSTTILALLCTVSWWLSVTNAQESTILNPKNVVVAAPAPRFFPTLFTGPLARRSLPLATAGEPEAEPVDSQDYVVQNLFAGNKLERNQPVYPIIFQRKLNKVWAPHTLRMEQQNGFGNAMKQILMRINY